MKPTPPAVEPLGPGAHIEPLTVAQYHAMMKHGIIREGSPIELLDGMLVRKDRAAFGDDIMTVGNRHRRAVDSFIELHHAVSRFGHHVTIQQPVTMGNHQEPEPDAAIIRGHRRDYSEHPGPADVLVAVEVSDSSLSFDRDTKLRTYARNGIREYWIVNLRENVVEVHRGPDRAAGTYGSRTDFRCGQSIRLDLEGGSIDVAIGDILPI